MIAANSWLSFTVCDHPQDDIYACPACHSQPGVWSLYFYSRLAELLVIKYLFKSIRNASPIAVGRAFHRLYFPYSSLTPIQSESPASVNETERRWHELFVPSFFLCKFILCLQIVGHKLLRHSFGALYYPSTIQSAAQTLPLRYNENAWLVPWSSTWLNPEGHQSGSDFACCFCILPQPPLLLEPVVDSLVCTSTASLHYLVIFADARRTNKLIFYC